MKNHVLIYFICASLLCFVAAIFLILYKVDHHRVTSHEKDSNGSRAKCSLRQTLPLAAAALFWGAIVPGAMYLLTKPATEKKPQQKKPRKKINRRKKSKLRFGLDR